MSHPSVTVIPGCAAEDGLEEGGMLHSWPQTPDALPGAWSNRSKVRHYIRMLLLSFFFFFPPHC